MAKNETQDALLAALQLASNTQQVTGSSADILSAATPRFASSLGEDLTRVATQLTQLATSSQDQAQAASDNTLALVQNTIAKDGISGASIAGTIAKAFASTITSGFGFSPLISGLVRLFGGGKTEAPASLVEYIRPPSIRFEGGVSQSSGGEIIPIDYGQGGQPRSLATPGMTLAPQITIQVQAMDSRSFLDHSEDIAMAVKEAMLHSHSLNDVVNEL